MIKKNFEKRVALFEEVNNYLNNNENGNLSQVTTNEKFLVYAYYGPRVNIFKNLGLTSNNCEVICSRKIGNYNFHYICDHLNNDKNKACTKYWKKLII